MTSKNTTPNAAAIVGIEHQGSNIVLAIRDGSQQLAVTLTPRRAALIQARLAYATAEALLWQQNEAAALARAQAEQRAARVLHRSNIAGIEGANDAALQTHAAASRMAAELTQRELQRIAQPEGKSHADRNC